MTNQEAAKIGLACTLEVMRQNRRKTLGEKQPEKLAQLRIAYERMSQAAGVLEAISRQGALL